MMTKIKDMKAEIKAEQLEKKIEKLKELLNAYKRLTEDDSPIKIGWLDIKRLESEISALEAGQSEPDKEPQQYHLNCDKCDEPYWSVVAFPEPQLCSKCIEAGQPEDEIDLNYIKIPLQGKLTHKGTLHPVGQPQVNPDETHTDFYEQYAERPKERFLGEVPQSDESKQTEEIFEVILNVICNREQLVNLPFSYKKTLAAEIVEKVQSFRSSGLRELSDEEIEKEFPTDETVPTFEIVRTNKAKQIGAKWLRSKIEKK
jgi:hypothetical protein